MKLQLPRAKASYTEVDLQNGEILNGLQYILNGLQYIRAVDKVTLLQLHAIERSPIASQDYNRFRGDSEIYCLP